MKMLPSGAISTSFGSLSCSGGLPATPGVPMVINTLPCGLNLITVWPLPAASGNCLSSSGRGGAAIGGPDVALLVDEHPVGPQQQPFAETLQHFAVGIELHDRIDVGSGARVAAAPIPGPDALAVHMATLMALTEPHLRPLGKTPKSRTVS
jgi:hypothetical protein